MSENRPAQSESAVNRKGALKDDVRVLELDESVARLSESVVPVH
jgi:hypothetical protein